VKPLVHVEVILELRMLREVRVNGMDLDDEFDIDGPFMNIIVVGH